MIKIITVTIEQVKGCQRLMVSEPDKTLRIERREQP